MFTRRVVVGVGRLSSAYLGDSSAKHHEPYTPLLLPQLSLPTLFIHACRIRCFRPVDLQDTRFGYEMSVMVSFGTYIFPLSCGISISLNYHIKIPKGLFRLLQFLCSKLTWLISLVHTAHWVCWVGTKTFFLPSLVSCIFYFGGLSQGLQVLPSFGELGSSSGL